MEFSERELPPAHVQVGIFHLRKMLFIAPPTSIYIYPHQITITSPSQQPAVLLVAQETRRLNRSSGQVSRQHQKRCSFPKTQKAGVCPAHTALLFGQAKWCGEGGELCKPAKKDSSSDGI